MRKLKYFAIGLLFAPAIAYAVNVTVPQSTGYGQVLVGNATGGNYSLFATSSLGLPSFSTTSAAYWLSTKTTSDLPEGSNLYYTSGRGLADFITNLAATTSVKSITTLPSLSLPYSQITGSPASVSFPFTVQSYGVSTSTTIGFLNGLFSTASSTFNSSFFLPALTQGFLYTGTNGQAQTIASSSIKLSWFTNDAGFLTSLAGAASSTLLGDNNTWSGANIFNSAPKLGSLSGFIGGNNGTLYGFATSTIKTSQLTNDAGFVTSLSGAASSTLLGDNNTFTGTDIFNNLKVGSANQILYTNASGVVTSAASSSLSLPNAALQNSSITVNGTSVSLGGSVTVSSTTLLANNNTFSGTNIFNNTITGSISGNAGTATALAGNGTNCSSGFFPLGVDASGNSEGCTYVFATTSPWSAPGILLVGSNGSGYLVASSSLNLPNTALQNSSLSINGSSVSLGGSITVSSTTLLANNNTFSGSNTFTNAPVLGSLTGLIKGSSGTLSAASNGTDFTLITAKTCTGSDFVSAVTAAGVFTCTTPAGTTYTGTWPISISGSVISWAGLATSSNLTSGRVHYSTGVNTFADVATSSIANGSGITVTNGSSAYVIGSQPSIACNTATGSVFGCLTAADWLNFNNKVATSVVPTVGQLAYWTGAGTPSTIGSVATSALGVTGPITFSGTIGAQVGGVGGNFGCATCVLTSRNINTTWPITGGGALSGDLTLAFSGLSTTSPWTQGQVAYVNSSNTVTSVATTTLSATSPLTGSFTVIQANGTTGSVGCQTASGSQAGCLASADWTTFNNKLTTYNPFTTATNFGKTVVATTSPVGATSLPIWFESGLYASSTAIFDNATSTNATTTNLAVTSVKSALHLGDANGLVTAYGGASACGANNFVTALSAVGGTTCGTAAISGVNLGGTLAALTAGTTLTSGGTYTGATARTFDIDLTHANAWTGLQSFTNASSTLQSVFSKLYVGGTATTTIDSTGNIVIPSGSGLTITGKSDGCATFLSGVLNSTGSACGGSSGAAYPFQVAGNATSTLTQFNGGLTAYASSTITALTVTNGTTTNATSSNLFVGTSGGTSDSFFTQGPTGHEWSLIAASSSAAKPYLFSIASSTDGSFPALTIDKNLLVMLAGGYISQASSTVVSTLTVTGGVTASTTAVNTPAFNFGQAPTTGIGVSPLGNMTFYVNGTGYWDVTSAGNLRGIGTGVFYAPAGSVTAPSYAFSADTSTGLYGPNGTHTIIFTTNGVEAARFDSSQRFGVGSSTPWAQVSIGTTTSSAVTTPLFAVSSSTQNASAFIAGIFGGGKFGIGTTTPWAALSLDRNAAVASSTIVVNEYAYGTATSTTETVDCRTAEQSHIRIGSSATTITLTGGVPGQTCRVIVENPNLGTPGALTWGVSAGYLLLWAGGTTPTATATNNKQDIYSFLVTQGSSTIDFIGAQSASF